MCMTSAARILVKGRVHGVFFRDNTAEQAMRLGIVGYVRNVPDGVEIIAEGEKAKIEKLVAWCSKGPVLAHVDSVDVAWQKSTGKYKSFEVRH